MCEMPSRFISSRFLFFLLLHAWLQPPGRLREEADEVRRRRWAGKAQVQVQVQAPHWFGSEGMHLMLRLGKQVPVGSACLLLAPRVQCQARGSSN